MKQSLMVLTGITYNYYHRKSNFVLLGFLDDTKVFTGIELQDEKNDFSDLSQIKDYLHGARYVCGIKDEKFQYMALDPRKGEISFSQILKRDTDTGYYGNEYLVYAGPKPLLQGSLLKFCDEEYYFCDDQLNAIVSVALSSQDVNLDWREIQRVVEEKAIMRHQQVKGFLKVDGNVSDR